VLLLIPFSLSTVYSPFSILVFFFSLLNSLFDYYFSLQQSSPSPSFFFLFFKKSILIKVFFCVQIPPYLFPWQDVLFPGQFGSGYVQLSPLSSASVVHLFFKSRFFLIQDSFSPSSLHFPTDEGKLPTMALFRYLSSPRSRSPNPRSSALYRVSPDFSRFVFPISLGHRKRCSSEPPPPLFTCSLWRHILCNFFPSKVFTTCLVFICLLYYFFFPMRFSRPSIFLTPFSPMISFFAGHGFFYYPRRMNPLSL